MAKLLCTFKVNLTMCKGIENGKKKFTWHNVLSITFGMWISKSSLAYNFLFLPREMFNVGVSSLDFGHGCYIARLNEIFKLADLLTELVY
jgi:hypothetical protein